MPTIKLQSSDGDIFPVDVEIAKQSVTIKTMLEDLGVDEDEEELVPLPNVNAAILKKVIQWATYHKDDPPPPEDDENKEKRTDDISSWDADFLKVCAKIMHFHITSVVYHNDESHYPCSVAFADGTCRMHMMMNEGFYLNSYSCNMFQVQIVNHL